MAGQVCASCGSPIQTGHQFCGNCGQRVEVSGPTGRRGRWLYGTVLAVLALGAAVVGFLLFREDPETITIVVDPDEAVVVDHPSGLTINIPAGVLAARTEVMVGLAKDAPPPEDGLVMPGPVWEFSVEGNPLFLKPVELVIPYEESIVPDGRMEVEAFPVYWNGSEWIQAWGEVDEQANTITVATLHNDIWSYVYGVVDWIYADDLNDWVDEITFEDPTVVEIARWNRDRRRDVYEAITDEVIDQIDEIEALHEEIPERVTTALIGLGSGYALRHFGNVVKQATGLTELPMSALVTLESGGVARVLLDTSSTYFIAETLEANTFGWYLSERAKRDFAKYWEAECILWYLENPNTQTVPSDCADPLEAYWLRVGRVASTYDPEATAIATATVSPGAGALAVRSLTLTGFTPGTEFRATMATPTQDVVWLFTETVDEKGVFAGDFSMRGVDPEGVYLVNVQDLSTGEWARTRFTYDPEATAVATVTVSPEVGSVPDRTLTLTGFTPGAEFRAEMATPELDVVWLMTERVDDTGHFEGQFSVRPNDPAGVYLVNVYDLATGEIISERFTWDPALVSDNVIAFASLDRDDNGGTGFDIWTIDPADPTVTTQVTDAPGDEIFPRWSPDGSQIAYWKDNSSIWVVGVDGSNARQIATTDNPPSFWSGDGTRVYFAARFSGFFWVDVNGPATQTGTHVAGSTPYVQPDISADGTQLAFLPNPTSPKIIYTADFDGSSITNVQPVVNTADGTCGASTVEVTLPAWAPDGSFLAFGRDTGGHNSNPHIITPAGTGCTQVVALPSSNHSRWSPDSQWLTFAPEGPSGDRDIYITLADGSGTPINLTNDNIWDMTPDWSHGHPITEGRADTQVDPALLRWSRVYTPDGIMTDVSAWENGLVAVGTTLDGDAAVWTSSDGYSWTEIIGSLAGVPGDQVMNALATGGPGLVAVGVDDTEPGGPYTPAAAAWVSDDGLEWSRVLVEGAESTSEMNDVVALDTGLLVAVGHRSYANGSGPAVWTTTDGFEWVAVDTHPSPGEPNGEMFEVAVGGPGLVAAGSLLTGDPGSFEHHYALWISKDGVSWKQVLDERKLVLDFMPVSTGSLGIVALENGNGQSPSLWTSSDGTTWMEGDPGLAPSQIRDLIQVGGTIVAFGDFAGIEVWVSPDATQWRNTYSGGCEFAGATAGIVAGPGMVAVGGCVWVGEP